MVCCTCSGDLNAVQSSCAGLESLLVLSTLPTIMSGLECAVSIALHELSASGCYVDLGTYLSCIGVRSLLINCTSMAITVSAAISKH